MKINFYIRYHTIPGEELFISGNNQFLGDNDQLNAIKLSWFNEDFWFGSIVFPEDFDDTIHYKYFLKDKEGAHIFDAEENRFIDISLMESKSYSVYDTWNAANEIGNVFFKTPFRKILLPPVTKVKTDNPKKITHQFRIKAPLLKPGETICLCGSTKNLKSWNTQDVILLAPENNWFTAGVCLEENEWPAAYKYGIYNTLKNEFICFENGKNRFLQNFIKEDGITIINDGFLNLPMTKWRGAGVLVPVFSLRSKKSFGVGEFSDLILLVDWAKKTGIKLIQLLPVNDTIAHYNWRDSYPYAAISAFALHPLYINLEKVAGKEFASIIKPLKNRQEQLNELKEFDYEQVMKFKLLVLKELYDVCKNELKNNTDYFEFFELNRYWLVPYAAFSYLRDKYKTPDFLKWESNRAYDEITIQELVSPSQKHYDQVAFFYFVQYHLHLQLKEISDYAHKQKIVLKGDIPIGIFRYSCDAWVNPALYNMDQQSGAPPDDFAVKGQNWGFPTYNWKEMSKDNYSWWRRRFDQMSNYFDAFRIDHILGFFRIWSIPMNAVEGVMGRFVPAVPIDITEFYSRGITFNHDRYCTPFITEDMLEDIFKDKSDEIKEKYFDKSANGNYSLKEFVNTQAKVVEYFKDAPDENLKHSLFDLISNIILFEDENSNGKKFHFRIAIDKTSSYQHLDANTKSKMWQLYIDYFYKRQDSFWQKEGMNKLPQLIRNTNMLVCGEDLGMVPPCVPYVMAQLGILGLEVERMPKVSGKEFFHPNDAPYLSVVTPSTHDMSTIRGWWEENREQTQRFYNFMLGQYGKAPLTCEAWINKRIVQQHLYSPAIWSIFRLVDLLGMDEDLRSKNPQDDRINVPSNPDNYWHYRMNLDLETLIKAKEFNEDLKKNIEESGRLGI